MSRLVVFIANVILAQLAVKLLCEGTGASVPNTKADDTSSALTRESSSFVNLQTCGNTKNLLHTLHLSPRLSAHKPRPMPKHLFTPRTSRPMPRTIDVSEQDIFCAKPAKQHAAHWYLQRSFNIQGLVWNCSSHNNQIQCPYAELSIAFAARKLQRVIRCTQTGMTESRCFQALVGLRFNIQDSQDSRS